MTSIGSAMSSDGSVICAEGLARSFDGGRVPAVKDVSLAMRLGESVAIMGQSGSGKSTLLNLLCGLDRPDCGRVLIDGREPGSRAAWAEVRARRIGMVFQGFNLLPALTACENVEIPMFGVRAGAAARRERALTLLSQVGLAGRERHRPAELSGGERQRVAIARSLANDPVVLLADEPTGSLDSTTAQAVLELLLGLHRMHAMALLIVTHDRDVAAVADQRLTMKDGRLA